MTKRDLLDMIKQIDDDEEITFCGGTGPACKVEELQRSDDENVLLLVLAEGGWDVEIRKQV